MFKIHSLKGNIYLEDQLIYKAMTQIKPCYIDGLLGKINLMGIDILICIVESECIGPIKRIKRVLVMPLSANIALHLNLFPETISTLAILPKLPEPVVVEILPERKKSLYESLQPTLKAGVQSATKLLRDTNRMVNDLSFDDVINSICDLFSNGTFYFSDSYDLFDEHHSFVFNSDIFNKLGHLDVFGKHIMQGSAKFESFEVEGNSFDFILISRRSKYRNGLRYEKRGIDELGYVANYVETIQKLSTTINKQKHIFKYTQVRGSVPLFWSQEKGMKPIPKLKEVPAIEQQAALTVHLEKLKSIYHKVVLLSLVEMQNKEGILGMAFQDIYNTLQDQIRENTQ